MALESLPCGTHTGTPKKDNKPPDSFNFLTGCVMKLHQVLQTFTWPETASETHCMGTIAHIDTTPSMYTHPIESTGSESGVSVTASHIDHAHSYGNVVRSDDVSAHTAQYGLGFVGSITVPSFKVNQGAHMSHSLLC